MGEPDADRIACLSLSEDLCVLLGGTGRDQDVALWRVCCDVCNTLSHYYRRPTPIPLVPEPFRGIESGALRQLVGSNERTAQLFGEFRNAVLEYEELCARRLDALRSTARTLLRLREHATDVARIDAMLSLLGGFVHDEWQRDLDLSGDRNWSLRVSRRYNLLPVEWRYL